jgi:DNA-binding protein Fis
MPALRDRQGDVPLWVEHFLDRFRREHGRTGLELEPACVPLLAAWPWRGNVRELEHCLERAVLLAKGPRILPPELGLPHPGGRAGRAGVIGTRIGFSSGPGTGAWADSEDGGTDDPARTLSELLRPLIGGPQPPTLKEALAIPEREIIRLALELQGGNRQATAKMLDVNRSTLFNKMRKHGLMDIPSQSSSSAEATTALADGSQGPMDGSRNLTNGSRGPTDGSRSPMDGSRGPMDGSRSLTEGSRNLTDGSHGATNSSRGPTDSSLGPIEGSAADASRSPDPS